MNTIVVASGNKGKIIQIKNFFSEYDVNVKIKNMKDFDIKEPIENGKSYDENALIKARHTFKITGLPTLADDSGLNIDALNGFPGLVTGRFAEACGGYEKSFEIISKCLESSSKAISFSTWPFSFIIVFFSLAFAFFRSDFIRIVEYNKYGPVFPSKSANFSVSKI